MFMQHATELEGLNDRTALWEAALSVFDAVGLSYVIYLVSNQSRSQVTLLTNVPEIYAQVDPAMDPFLQYCCNSYDVTRTGTAYLPENDYLPEAARPLIHLAERSGFISGLGVPTRLESSARFGGFNLGSGLSRADFETRFAAHVPEIQALCFLLHRRLEELDRTGDLATASLSPREAEIIRMIANGMTRKECAQSLGLSPNTVADYTKAAYRKLGVRNRVEAARVFLG